MSFLRTHQLSIMLFMSGFCGALVCMSLAIRSVSVRRKLLLALMEATATLLLLTDRYCYIYRGNTTELGFLVVRVGNALVFFLPLLISWLVTRYLAEQLGTQSHAQAFPRRRLLCDLLFALGTALLLLSQFTGLYYTIDAQNLYRRAAGFPLHVIIAFLILIVQESVIIQYRAQLSPRTARSLMLCLALPSLASLAQVFTYGVSLANLTVVLVVSAFYVYTLNDLSRAVESAQLRELENWKEAQQREAALFEQTAEALSSAIDAKDRYTHGHSARVAACSRLIAQHAGLSDKECREVYFAALLHDVGKIGIRDEIISKPGALSEEEYAQIRLHPLLGAQILSRIRQSPYLSLGAHYHHERLDGTGYPEGLRGEEIPVLARIISVADAYDAMTSRRSYRAPLSAEDVKRELREGAGRQFDPYYTEIMLELIDSGALTPQQTQEESPDAQPGQ